MHTTDMTIDRVANAADWRTDDDAAWELCHAATARVVQRLREFDASTNETFGEAWDRVVGAMADEREALAAAARSTGL